MKLNISKDIDTMDLNAKTIALLQPNMSPGAISKGDKHCLMGALNNLWEQS